MPEPDIRIGEQAVHDLAQPHSSPMLRDKIQDGKAAKPIGGAKKLPARHGLPRKLEQVIEPLGTTAGQDRLGLGPFDDQFDLRTARAYLAELDLDLSRPGRQQSRSYQITGQSCSPRREAECRHPQPMQGTEHRADKPESDL